MLRKEEYDFLKALRMKGKENVEANKVKNVQQKEMIDLIQMRILLSEHPGLNPASPFKLPYNEKQSEDDDDDIENPSYPFKHIYDVAKLNIVKEYISECGLNDFVLIDGFKFGISTNGLKEMDQYERHIEEISFRERETAAAEKTLEATEKVALSVQTQNLLQKDALKGINDTLNYINSNKIIEKDTLIEIKDQIVKLELLAETNVEDEKELQKAMCHAEKAKRTVTICYYVALIFLFILSIAIGVMLVFHFKGLEHPIAWQFVFAALPLIVDIILAFLKTLIIRDKEYYASKYLKKNR